MRKIFLSFYLSLLLLLATFMGMLIAFYPDKIHVHHEYSSILGFNQVASREIETKQLRKNVQKNFLESGLFPKLTVSCEESLVQFSSIIGINKSIETMKNVDAKWQGATLKAEKATFIPSQKKIAFEKATLEQPNPQERVCGIEMVQAGSSEYDGELLHLSNGIEAIFPNIVLKAREGILFPKKNQKKFDLEKMTLSHDVKIISRTGEGNTFIEGDKLDARFEEGAIQSFVVSGYVKMNKQHGNQKEYALADSAEYNAHTKTWKFLSEKPRKVLYYDEANSMTISASQVLVQQIEGQVKPKVKAIGDVRFSFADKELNEIRQRFHGKGTP